MIPGAERPRPFSQTCFMTSSEVMRLLNFKDRTAFWEFVHRNGVPFVRLTRRKLLFEEANLRAWLDRRSVGRISR